MGLALLGLVGGFGLGASSAHLVGLLLFLLLLANGVVCLSVVLCLPQLTLLLVDFLLVSFCCCEWSCLLV